MAVDRILYIQLTDDMEYSARSMKLVYWGLRKIVFLSANLRQSSRILNGLAQISEDWRIKFEFCVSPIYKVCSQTLL